MVRSRNASAVMFGFEFQIYAGIYLMLSEITNMDRIKIEGQDEDIEVVLKNGKTIYAQAKAFKKPFDADTSLKRKKFKKALESLCEVNECGVEHYLYITNLAGRNPLSSDSPEFSLQAQYTFSYNELPNECRKLIDEILSKTSKELDTSRLKISAFNFYGDDKETRRNIVSGKLEKILTERQLNNLVRSSNQILDQWYSTLFASGGNQKTAITKEDIAYDLVFFSILQLESNAEGIADKLNIEEAEALDALQQYEEIINSGASHFLNYNKVLQLYDEYVLQNNQYDTSKMVTSFIRERAMTIYEEVFSDDLSSIMDKDTAVICAQVTAYRILMKRKEIGRIKKGIGVK